MVKRGVVSRFFVLFCIILSLPATFSLAQPSSFPPITSPHPQEIPPEAGDDNGISILPLPEQQKIQTGTVNSMRKRIIIPDIEQIVQETRSRQESNQHTKDRIEDTKQLIRLRSQADVDTLPKDIIKRVRGRTNIIVADFLAQLSPLLDFFGLTNKNAPLFLDVYPNLLDTKTCKGQGDECGFRLFVDNVYDPHQGRRDQPFTFVIVNVEEPVNEWQRRWSEDIQILSISKASDEVLTLSLPNLNDVNKIRIRIANYIDGDIYTSRPQIVDIVGVPPQPELVDARLDPQGSIIVLGSNFFPPDSYMLPNGLHTILLIGDLIDGQFINGQSVDFLYQGPTRLLFRPDQLGGKEETYILAVNKAGERFTVSSPTFFTYDSGGGEECGNDIQEGNEECDGSDDDQCPGSCQGDCTCGGSGGTCGDTICSPEEGENSCSCVLDCPGTCREDCDNLIDDNDDGLTDCEDILTCCGEEVCSDSPYCQVDDGDHIATLELAIPPMMEYPIHALLPLPPGKYTKDNFEDGVSSFKLVDSTGATVPVDTLCVTRKPNGQDCDVVELVGKATRPEGSGGGDRVQYKIIYSLHDQPVWPTSYNDIYDLLAEGPTPIPASIKELLAQPLIVRTYDPFGHEYTADITDQQYGRAKIFRYGNYATQVRTYNVLKPAEGTPIGPPNGALTHALGVHAYFTVWADQPVLQLDIRLSNGAAGLDATPDDNALLDLYLKNVEILVDTDYSVFTSPEDAGIGESYMDGGMKVHQIIKPENNGKMHLWPERSRTTRRMAIAPTQFDVRARSIIEHDILAFPVFGISTTPEFGELYSWHNPITSAYYTSKIYAPNFDHLIEGSLHGAAAMRAWLNENLGFLKSYIESGQSTNGNLPFIDGRLGWANPQGVHYGGMTGGDGIDLIDGLETVGSASQEGYRATEIHQRTYEDRQSTALYNRNGEPVSYEDVTFQHAEGPYVPINFFSDFLWDESCPGFQGGKCDPFGYHNAPTFQIDYVQSNNLKPNYEDTLRAFQDIDRQHLVRTSKQTMVLIWTGNDAIAKDNILSYAHETTFQHTLLPYGYSGGNPLYDGCIAPECMSGTPNIGGGFGRGSWHPTQTMVAAYSAGSDQFRNDKRKWFDGVLGKQEHDIIECTGLIHGAVSKTSDHQYRMSARNEESMGDNSMRGMLKTVYEGADAAYEQRIRDVLRLHYYSLMKDVTWDPQTKKPRAYVAIADKDTLEDVYCTWDEMSEEAQDYSGGGQKFETQYTAAYGHMDTGDEAFAYAGFRIMENWDVNSPTILAKYLSETRPNKQYLGNAKAVGMAYAQRNLEYGLYHP